jgi:hypothetical protein
MGWGRAVVEYCEVGGPFYRAGEVGRWPAGSDVCGGAFSSGGRLRRGGEEEAAPIEGGERRRRPRGVWSRAEEVAGGHGGGARRCSVARRRRVQLLGEEEGEGGFSYFTSSEARDVNFEGANAEVACWAGWAEKRREEMGRGRVGKGERRPGRNYFLGLKSNRVKENQF